MNESPEANATSGAVISSIIKTVYHNDFRDSSFHLKVGIVQPDLQSSLLLKIDCEATEKLSGIHILSEIDSSFQFVNFDWALKQNCIGASRVTAYLKIDLTIAEGERRFLVLIDPSGTHRTFGYVCSDKGRVHAVSTNPLLCTIVDLLQIEPTVTPVFVGGAPKSGTTWVEMLLNAHPDCVITGENGFWEWPFNAHVVLPPVSPDERFVRKVSVLGSPFSNAKAMMGFGRAEITFRQLANLTGSTHVGDKTPSNSLYALQALQMFRKGHYIHCYRHPLDVIVSRAYHEILIIRGRKDLEEIKDGSIISKKAISSIHSGRKDITRIVKDILSDRLYLARILDEWLASNHYAGIAKGQFPDRVHYISYEKLYAEPCSVMRFLFQQIGLAASLSIVEQAVEACTFSKISGGREAGVADENSFFRKGQPGDREGRFDTRTIEWTRNFLEERGAYFVEEYFDDGPLDT